jgi:hypothetical protein
MDYYNYLNTTTSAIAGIIGLVVLVLVIIAGWRVFTKAGKPGWAIIIPIYNVIVLCQVAGKPGWWFILYCIPIVNIIIAIIVSIALAKAFGKSGAFGFFLLFLLSIIGWLILGFGKAQYQLKSA